MIDRVHVFRVPESDQILALGRVQQLINRDGKDFGDLVRVEFDFRDIVDGLTDETNIGLNAHGAVLVGHWRKVTQDLDLVPGDKDLFFHFPQGSLEAGFVCRVALSSWEAIRRGN